MMNEDKALSQYDARVQRIETQMAVVLVQHANIEHKLDKHDILLEALVRGVSGQEYQTKAIISLNEQQTKDSERHGFEIEQIKKEQVDVGKILSSFGVQLSIIKVVGTALFTLVLGYLFTIFVK